MKQHSKFIENELSKATERTRNESKEVGRALDFRLKPTNEIERIKKSMEFRPVGVPYGCHGSYTERTQDFLKPKVDKEKWID